MKNGNNGRSFLFASLFLSFVFALAIVAPIELARASSGMMSSSNYTIEADSVNFGGGNSTSTNYVQ